MKMLFAGGAGSGKSMAAQEAARDLAGSLGGLLCYVATMIPSDDEDRARIAAHIEARKGWGFTTIERGKDICGLETEPGAVYLLDSVTALLGNEMFGGGGADLEAPSQLCRELADFAAKSENVIFVSDWIFGDAPEGSGSYDPLTERYREGLAMINNRLASLCDRVFECSAGMRTEWK